MRLVNRVFSVYFVSKVYLWIAHWKLHKIISVYKDYCIDKQLLSNIISKVNVIINEITNWYLIERLDILGKATKS